MNELEQLLHDTSCRSAHLWAHLSALRDCAAAGLPIVIDKLRQGEESLLSLCQTEEIRNRTREACESVRMRQRCSIGNALFLFGYSIAEAQSLDCVRIVLKVDASLGDTVQALEKEGLPQRAEFLLNFCKPAKVWVPHMKEDLQPAALNDLCQIRDRILHGPRESLIEPIHDLDEKLDYLRHTCIYLTDLVMHKYNLFMPPKSQ